MLRFISHRQTYELFPVLKNLEASNNEKNNKQIYIFTNNYGVYVIGYIHSRPENLIVSVTRRFNTCLTESNSAPTLTKRSLNTALDRSRLDDSDTEDMVMNYVTDFENATDALKQKFDAKNSVNGDVEDVLNRASYINQFMTRNKLNTTAQRDWRYLKTDLTTLANYYSVAFDFNRVPTNTTVATTNPTRVSDAQVQTLLTRIEANTDTFKRRLTNGLDRSTLNNTNAEDSIANYIKDFENSTDQLKQRFDARRAVARDVEDVLIKANFIDGFFERLSSEPQSSKRLDSDQERPEYVGGIL